MAQPNATSRRGNSVSDIVSLLKAHSEDLPPPEQADAFGLAFARYGDARVVLLGEASHGTSEFYRARAAITRHLVQNFGFNIVAVEADWPDAARLDRHVRHLSRGDGETPFARFPSWMWKNVEVRDFIAWLRAHNELISARSRVEFRGLDLYSLNASIAAVLRYLDQVDPEAASEARRRYGCLTPWQDDPAQYGRRAAFGGASCEPLVRAQLIELLEHRLAYAGRDGDSFFDAAQNARIVRAAEEYYRVMYEGSRGLWNLRDTHMFETLERLLRHRGPHAKAIVWAHNSHIGNATATSMGWEGEINIGYLCRQRFGREAVLIGFGTNTGTVAAASDWDAPMEIKTVNPVREDSYEHLFHQTGHERSLTDWRASDRADLREALKEVRRQRAIGVIYRPESELLSHYFQTALSDQFDAHVWFEHTHAIAPLVAGAEGPGGETYPFGL